MPRRLAALLAAAAPFHGSTLGAGFAREWDELRVARVDPHFLSTFASPQHSEGGFGDLLGAAKVYLFGKDWFWIEGSASPANFASSNFQFTAVDAPSEWSVRVTADVPVVMRVGTSCRCALQGISVYSTDDKSAWMRLQFGRCTGCESGATRAAAVMGLRQDTSQDSNLFAWMCAISSEHFFCDPNNFSEEMPTTTTTTSTSPANVTKEPTPATTLPPQPCAVSGGVTVETTKLEPWQGPCEEPSGKEGTYKEHQYDSVSDCEKWCESTYNYVSGRYSYEVDELNKEIDKINKEPEVCRAFSYDASSGWCRVYTAPVQQYSGTDKAQLRRWSCTGHVHAKKFKALSDTSLCTVTATTTSTSMTSTLTSTATTTTTVTRQVQSLSFVDLFRARAEGGRVFGYPGDSHFPQRGFSATLLQLQSRCFTDVDYYVLDAEIPVHIRVWSQVMQIIKDYGDIGAWSKVDMRNNCPTSASVDRLPVDSDFRHSQSAGLSDLQHALLTLGFSVFLGFVGGFATMGLKSYQYGSMFSPMDNYPKVLGFASGVAVLMLLSVWLLGQGVSFLFFRLAVKKFAWSGAADWYSIAPMLSDSTLPCAFVVLLAAFIMWSFPTLGTSSATQDAQEAEPLTQARADSRSVMRTWPR